MAEFPLASLAGFTAAEVTSATLTVTIDDVIGTFGPGANFDGTASSPIAAYSYPADGTVAVADFSPAGLSPLGTIAPGAITDATLDLDGSGVVRHRRHGGGAGVPLGGADAFRRAARHHRQRHRDLARRPITARPASRRPAPVPHHRDHAGDAAGLLGRRAQVSGRHRQVGGRSRGGAAEELREVSRRDLEGRVGERARGRVRRRPATRCSTRATRSRASPRRKPRQRPGITKACDGLTPADVHSPCDAGAATFAATATCIVDATETCRRGDDPGSLRQRLRAARGRRLRRRLPRRLQLNRKPSGGGDDPIVAASAQSALNPRKDMHTMTSSRALAMLLGALVGASSRQRSRRRPGGYPRHRRGDDGTVHDSIGDGWFFADVMNPPPPDGVGDAAQQALGVGVESERARAAGDLGVSARRASRRSIPPTFSVPP